LIQSPALQLGVILDIHKSAIHGLLNWLRSSMATGVVRRQAQRNTAAQPVIWHRASPLPFRGLTILKTSAIDEVGVISEML